MPRLPPDFVKAPAKDGPRRATKLVRREDARGERDGSHELVLSVDEALWKALQAACEREGTTPVDLVKRIVEEWLTADRRPVAAAAAAPAPVQASTPSPNPIPTATPTAAPARPAGLVTQLVELVQAQLGRLTLVRRLMALRV